MERLVSTPSTFSHGQVLGDDSKAVELFSSSGHSDDRITLATEPADIRSAFKQGKLAGFPAIEGAHCLGKRGKHTRQQRLDRIDELLINLACDYFTLTHFTRNDDATSAS